MKKLVVLSGAGISAESGIRTFRDANGLWEGHDIMEVASPEGFKKNPELVLEFYNIRRKQLLNVHPNDAHKLLVNLENDYDVHIITQNVDDLHERAGNKNVLHLHGELLKVRSVSNEQHIYDWREDLNTSHKDINGSSLRPHIVWFGEAVPMIEEAIRIVSDADIFVIIGTSMQVYPAASLIDYVPANAKVYYIDVNPTPLHAIKHKVKVISDKASKGLKQLIDELRLDTN